MARRWRRKEHDETSYTLFYSEGLGAPVKSLFQGLFESLLARKSEQHQLIKVLRFAPVACSECSTAVDRSQMRKRLADGKDFAFCAECGERLSLPPADEPVQLNEDVKQKLNVEQATVDRRVEFEGLVYKLTSRAHAEGIDPKRCFLSYA